jgi:hypothetical protein
MNDRKLHGLELLGLGEGPWRYAGFGVEEYQACPGAPVQPGASCDACATGIKNVYYFKNTAGKVVKLGSECVHKHGRKSEITAMQRDKREHERKLRRRRKNLKGAALSRLAREASCAWYAACAKPIVDEYEHIEREAKKAAAQDLNARRYGWVIEQLDATKQGDFVQSMRRQVAEGQGLLEDRLSDRCFVIVREICGKTAGGRKGSKKYDAAVAEFDAVIAAAAEVE